MRGNFCPNVCAVANACCQMSTKSQLCLSGILSHTPFFRTPTRKDGWAMWMTISGGRFSLISLRNFVADPEKIVGCFNPGEGVIIYKLWWWPSLLRNTFTPKGCKVEGRVWAAVKLAPGMHCFKVQFDIPLEQCVFFLCQRSHDDVSNNCTISFGAIVFELFIFLKIEALFQMAQKWKAENNAKSSVLINVSFKQPPLTTKTMRKQKNQMCKKSYNWCYLRLFSTSAPQKLEVHGNVEMRAWFLIMALTDQD